MSDKPKIVCLCGSTRFMDEFFKAGWDATLRGEIVLSVGVCKHAEHHGAEAMGMDTVKLLDELHFRKIDLADYVLVLNIGGYVGKSTAREILYAISQGKRVEFLEPKNEPCFKLLIELASLAQYECPVDGFEIPDIIERR